MKYFLSAILILFFAMPCHASDMYKVLKVIDGDTVYLDLNNDGKIQSDERVRLNGIDAFETKIGDGLQWQMRIYAINQGQALGLGYMGKEFAKKELEGKTVMALYTGETERCTRGRHLMSIYYGENQEKNFEQEILKAGLATVYSKSNLASDLRPYENIVKVKQNVKKAGELNLVYLNKNGKYHETTCKYARMSGDVDLTEIKKIKEKVPAQCCN